MFQELTETLTCEIKTLGYPKAAVFAFCLALVAYNGISVLSSGAVLSRSVRTATPSIPACHTGIGDSNGVAWPATTGAEQPAASRIFFATFARMSVHP